MRRPRPTRLLDLPTALGLLAFAGLPVPAGAASSPGEGAPRGDAPADDGPAGAGEETGGAWSGIPVIAHMPETSLMLGAAVVHTFRLGEEEGAPEAATARRSSAQAMAAFTLNGQYLASLGLGMYLGGERWRVDASADAAWFPSLFYGVGDATRLADEEAFTEQRVGLGVRATRHVVSSLRAGLQVAGRTNRVEETDAGALLDRGAVRGADGGLLVGLGPMLVWDDRDSNFDSRSGSLVDLNVGMFPEALGSDFALSYVELDARHYLSPWLDHGVALQVYARLMRGDVDFQSLSMLGRWLRGFYPGRFRDMHLVAAQVEYRAPLFWRIGASVFAGAGDVAAQLDAFDLTHPKVAAGGGLRFALIPRDRVNLRVDLAVTSTDETNLYVNLGEAF